MTQKSRAGHSTSISALDYGDKTLFVLAGASGGVSLCSFTTVIATLIAKASSNTSQVFLISNGIIKMILKTMGRKKRKHRKTDLFARGKTE